MAQARRNSLTGENNNFTLLKTLNTFTPRYNLYVRVTDRSPMTEFVNKRTSNTGYIFNITILDSEGICMNCKFWNAAAQKYDPLIQKDSVLKMNNPGRITTANKRYSTVEHNYEVSIDNVDADITVCSESNEQKVDGGDSNNNATTTTPAMDLPALPKAPRLTTCKFLNLRSVFLSAERLPYFGSFIGIIDSIQPTRSVQLRRGSVGSSQSGGGGAVGSGSDSALVRNVTLVDSTKHGIELSLWGPLCDQYPYEIGDILICQNVQFRQSTRAGAASNAIQASTIRSSEILVNSDQHPATQQYKQWYQEEGRSATYKMLSEATQGGGGDGANRTVVETDLKGMQTHIDANAHILDDTMGAGAQGLLYRIQSAFITDIAYRRADDSSAYSLIYDACVSCNKKANSQAQCPTCQGDSFIPKLSTAMSLSDNTASNIQVRCFTDQAQAILQRQPRQIKDLIESNEHAKLRDILEFEALWKRYAFVIRARKEMYNNSTRLSLIVVSATPVNHNAIVAQGMKAITQYLPTAFESSPTEKTPQQSEGIVKRAKVDVGEKFS